MIRKKLSQTLGAIKKGYAVDTYQGGFPVAETIKTAKFYNTFDDILSAYTLASGAVTVVSGSALSDPDNCRCLNVVANVESLSGEEVVVKGTNYAGQVISETLEIEDQITQTDLPFKSVLEVTLPARTESGATISIGQSLHFGMARTVLDEDVLMEIMAWPGDTGSGEDNFTTAVQLWMVLNPSGAGTLPVSGEEIYLPPIKVETEFDVIGLDDDALISGEMFPSASGWDYGYVRFNYKTDIF